MRTPATNNRSPTEPHRMIVVPRSRWRITSNDTTPMTGASGRSRCLGSSSRCHLLASTVAANATTASLRNSAGCSVTGPRSIQRDAPYRDVPCDGCRASSISGMIASRKRAGDPGPGGMRQAPRHHHRHETGHGIDQLPVEVPEARAVPLHRRDRTGRQDHDQAHHGQHSGGDEQHEQASAASVRRARARPVSPVPDDAQVCRPGPRPALRHLRPGHRRSPRPKTERRPRSARRARRSR